MKIINASWEERNLGVTCCEVTIEKDDSLLYIQDELSRLSSVQYLVIKVDTPNVEAHFFGETRLCFYRSKYQHVFRCSQLPTLCFRTTV